MRIKNRYLLLLIAALANFPTGSSAIWSIFQPYAKEIYHLETGTANMPYSLYMAAFVLGNITGGQLQSKYKSRVILYPAAVVMSLGFIATAFVPLQYGWMFSLTYGALGGFGSGIIYNVVIATISKWFPDKRGMATGLVVCIVGAHGMVMSPICNSLLKNHGLSAATIVIAVVYIALIFGLGWLIVPPEEGYMCDNVKTSKNAVSTKDYTAAEMVKTSRFFMVSGAMALGTMAYFLINPMVKSLAMERGVGEATAVATVMILSIVNCIGRMTIPWLSDKVGRKPMLMFLYIETMIAVIAMTKATGTLYVVCAAMIALGYGGFFGTFPAIAAEQFGSKHSGLNYGIIMIGYGIVCLLCPYLVSVGVTFAFMVAAATSIVGMIIVLNIKGTAAD